MNGVSYNFDDPVNVSGIETRRLRQMYDARMIEAIDALAPLPRPVAPPRAVAAPVVASDTPVGSGVPWLRHKGFGKFEVVDKAGNVVAGPLAKEQAERALANLS